MKILVSFRTEVEDEHGRIIPGRFETFLLNAQGIKEGKKVAEAYVGRSLRGKNITGIWNVAHASFMDRLTFSILA